MTSVDGYGAIRFFDSVFYKAPHRGSWENALTYNANQLLATFSRRFSNWDYASGRVHVSPFSWIDDGPKPSSFDDARSPEHVAEQLLAFRKWGMGGEFANYAYAPLADFDYSPYVPAMQAGSKPGNVDGVAPTLELTDTAGPTIEGTAHDNLAIRAVRWRDNRGQSGVARMNWEVLEGDYDSGYQWQTRWSFPAADISPAATRVELTAEDIKGNESRRVVLGSSGSSSGPGCRSRRRRSKAPRRDHQEAEEARVRSGWSASVTDRAETAARSSAGSTAGRGSPARPRASATGSRADATRSGCARATQPGTPIRPRLLYRFRIVKR